VAGLPASFDQMRNELGTDRILIESHQPGNSFVYLGPVKTDNDAGAVHRLLPGRYGGAGWCFGDGSVAQLSSRQFEETIQRDIWRPNQSATPPPA